ncbi:hypothetical protein GCM10027275_20630 [Rhabdobacter roseus]|uniref:Methane oxygenase PmoA n=1 Tax=Rhabdobacter roseus TaxID=1655419 RepID=A0A840TKQ9_9BACT|nr:PmoA family protein [Rhabdobacter roseus]MBB5283994.1 hypothetical protein [Rhabdobacter roseus]
MKKVLFAALIGWLSLPVQAQSLRIEVEAGPHARRQTPVYVTLPEGQSTDYDYYLQSSQTKKRVEAQLLDPATLFFVLDSLPAQSRATFTLKSERLKKNPKSKVLLDEQAEGIRVSVGTKPVFFYQTKEALPPAGKPDYYKRSGFIHPLYSPAQQVLTDDFPVGHTHHHALFSAWVNTTYKDSLVDFWNQHLRKGTVEHVQVLDFFHGTLVSRFKTQLRSVSTAFGEVLRENWTVTVYPFSDYFLFDIATEQTNTSRDTLFLNKYTYGGMAFRGSREWNRTDSAHFTNRWQILTDLGHDNQTANHTHARWVDATGTVAGSLAGLTVFGFPDNYRYPQAIRVHPDMPYWCYAPIVDGAFYIPPGGTYQARYRYYVHNGAPNLDQIRRIAQDVVEPVTVRVLE